MKEFCQSMLDDLEKRTREVERLISILEVLNFDVDEDIESLVLKLYVIYERADRVSQELNRLGRKLEGTQRKYNSNDVIAMIKAVMNKKKFSIKDMGVQEIALDIFAKNNNIKTHKYKYQIIKKEWGRRRQKCMDA